MKLLFDQNLSHRLADQLARVYPGSTHVRNVGLKAASDKDIWNFATANDFVVVSKDVDFQQRAILLGSPPKVVWVRLGNCSTLEVRALLMDRSDDLVDFAADTSATFIAIS